MTLEELLYVKDPVQLVELAPQALEELGWRALRPLILGCQRSKELGPFIVQQLERDRGPAFGALIAQLEETEYKALMRTLKGGWRKELEPFRDRTLDPDGLTPFGVVVANPLDVDPDEPWLPRGYLPLHPEAMRVARERVTESKPGHLLVTGPSGVGKSVFLQQLFASVAASHALYTLETSTGIVVAGMKYIGEWQGNLRKLVLATEQPRRVLIYFTDLMNLTSAGVSEGNTENFGSFLKPWLARGDITLVGEATPEQMLHLRRHPDVTNLFLEVGLEPPALDEMPAVVRTVLPELARECGRPIDVPDPVVERLVELSDLYVAGADFPGKTLALLRRVVKDRMRSPGDRLVLTPDDMIGALAGATGLPRWLLDDSTPMDLARTRAFFGERIIGQADGVKSVVDLITLIKAGLTDPGRPLAALLFVGPTGVGKTETAKALAEFVFGSPDRLLRFDMSEFKDYDSYQRLIGLPYGREELSEGLLTRRVRENPFSVLLLDEFEKAHPNVYDLMLQVFDDGRLTSARGEVVSFRQTIVIMTSNLGAGVASAGSLGILHRPSEAPSTRHVMKAVEEYFRPEFLNRIQVVQFQALDLHSMQQIARRELDAVLQRSGIRRRELTVDVDEAFLSLLLRHGFTTQYGARPLKRSLEQLLLLPLARKLVSGPSRASLVQVHCQGDQVKVRLVEPQEPRVREKEAGEVRSLASVRELLAACRQRLEGFPEEKAALVSRTGDERFWEDAEEARRVTARISYLETLLDGQAELEERCARVREAPEGLVQRVELWHRRLLHPEEDQRDAFVSVRGLEPEAPVPQVLGMLRGWAARMKLEVTELGPEALWISGPCAYGLLKSEHGLHRFVRKASESRRSSSLVRVDVHGAAPAEFALADVRAEARRRKGGSWARALHLPTVTVAEGANRLEPEENRAAMEGWLAAKLWRPAPEGGLVRVYYLEPEREVRDLASGLRSYHLDAVLAGELEQFTCAS